MKLAITQAAETVSINGGSGGFTPEDLLDYTFDTVYTSGDAQVSFDVVLGISASQTPVTYVGIAGHNMGSLGASIEIVNKGDVVVSGYVPIDDRPLMFTFDNKTTGEQFIRINITKASATDRVTIAHTACGDTTDLVSNTTSGQEVIKDYQGGYSRIPMTLNRKVRSSVNDMGAPTSTLVRTISPMLKLNLSNVPTEFAATSLLTYQRFWVNNGFFIQNDDDEKQSYLAFEFIPDQVKAHPQTRSLVNLGYKFKAYNGQ